MDREKVLELTRLADGLLALIDEAEARGSIPPFSGARDLEAALRQHLAGDPDPIRRLLGFVRATRGRPGLDTVAKLELLQAFRKLRDAGVTHEAAAERVGVDQTTISDWMSTEIGWAEATAARLDVADDASPTKVTGLKGTN
jgi:hypothetical protein